MWSTESAARSSTEAWSAARAVGGMVSTSAIDAPVSSATSARKPRVKPSIEPAAHMPLAGRSEAQHASFGGASHSQAAASRSVVASEDATSLDACSDRESA
eukprot:7140405-Prymnesium_polylepis.1